MENASKTRRNGAGFALGVTGGIGAGKSLVGRLFEKEGARLMDADQTAREVLHAPETREKLRVEFGDEIFTPDGQVSREKIASMVFKDKEKLRRLEAVIHPGVRARYYAARDSLQKGEILVYDVPLLFEAGLQDDFDAVLVVTAARDTRLSRAQARSGWSEEEFDRREAAQIPLTEKEKQADLIIRNEGSEEDVRRDVRAIYQKIKATAWSTEQEP